MSQNLNARIIRGEGRYAPPDEVRTIYPSNRLLWKFYLEIILGWIVLLISLLAFCSLIIFFIELDSEPTTNKQFFVETSMMIVVAIGLILTIPTMIILRYYVHSMEYIAHGDFITVKKGIINKTVKYVPYRVITNISTVAGIFDRLFKIGCVNIETAAKSGTSTKPEEKLEGLILYSEIRDYILRRLREYSPNGTKERSQTNVGKQIVEELREVGRLIQDKRG